MSYKAFPDLVFRGKFYPSEKICNSASYDVILITGDAYADHPAFPAAVLYRLVESYGYSCGIIAQPDWNNDNDFKALGEPKLCFLIAPGAMDSMISNYTANKMPRKIDRLSPDDKAGLRPKRTAYVYSNKLRELFPTSKIITGGIEASLRRYPHYDFWQDSMKYPILHDIPCDLLIYGMAESALERVLKTLEMSNPLLNLPQTAIKLKSGDYKSLFSGQSVKVESSEELMTDKTLYLKRSCQINTENLVYCDEAIQVIEHKKGDIVIFPGKKSDTLSEMTNLYKLRFQRLSHPIYEKPISALLPVQFSIQTHRGCLGTCSFCAIRLHQSGIIRSAPEEEILKLAESFKEHPDYKGIIPDVGGPAANMYGWNCRVGWCKINNCIRSDGTYCKNLQHSLNPITELLKKLHQVPGVRKAFIGSGFRYDLIGENDWDDFAYILKHHISGQLKVAPEHFNKQVLTYMAKAPEGNYTKFSEKFKEITAKNGKKLYLIPYLMTAFPGSDEQKDQELIDYVKKHKLPHQQIQEFTPSPGTIATAMYYTEMDQELNKIKVKKNSSARLQTRKKLQNRKPKRKK
ncbi:MAG: YgiQ family radical SAM protein [Candidatus Riflebacteria bacterium]|nr:YgiQ family radical SAM protein [Candidatus Riflebacteria bacterium]